MGLLGNPSVSDLVAIGKISGPAGLKGEVKVIRWSDSPGRFNLLRQVLLGHDAQEVREFAVERVRIAGKYVALKLRSINDRSSAEQLKDKLIFIPASERIDPPKGAFFVDDVLGMDVVTEVGKRVGVVREILRLPSNDLWQVKTESGMVSIPAVGEFIRSVDVSKKTIVIHEVEGLLDV